MNVATFARAAEVQSWAAMSRTTLASYLALGLPVARGPAGTKKVSSPDEYV